MLISLRKRLAILSMPKTGTTALEAALAPYCDIVYKHDPRAKHMPLRRFERFLRPYLRELTDAPIETACMIREPEAWLGSWYRYRARPALDGHQNSTRDMSFDAFVTAYLSEEKPPFARVGRPYRFVTTVENRVGVTHLYKYDSWPAYVAFMEERFGLTLTPERLNVSGEADLTLSDATRAALQSEMEEDYRVYREIAK